MALAAGNHLTFDSAHDLCLKASRSAFQTSRC